MCPQGDGVDCFCNESIAVAAPADCPHPQDFYCVDPSTLLTTLPTNDSPPDGQFVALTNMQFAECLCDSDRPLSQADCAPPRHFDCSRDPSCDVGSAGAQATSGPFDCDCLPPPVPIVL